MNRYGGPLPPSTGAFLGGPVGPSVFSPAPRDSNPALATSTTSSAPTVAATTTSAAGNMATTRPPLAGHRGGPPHALPLRLPASTGANPASGGMASGAESSSIHSDAGSHGLLGLLPVIRMEDQDRSYLALGTDLTSLGLALSQTDSLAQIFASPWSDDNFVAEPYFSIPSSFPRGTPELTETLLQPVQEDTLFTVFYSMPRDALQALAALELSKRGWRFHETYKSWFLFPSDPASEAGKRLTVFDAGLWGRKLSNFTSASEEMKPAGFVSAEALETNAKEAMAHYRAQQQQRGGGSGAASSASKTTS